MAKNQNKTTENNASVTDFLNTIDDAQKQTDCKELIKVFQEISDCKPKMWGSSIIGFGTYHYKYDSGREGDFMRVGFSPRKNAVTLYIMDGFTKRPELMDKLGKFKTGKSCLYIKKLDDIDREVLKEVVESSVAYMDEKYPRK